MAKRIKDTDYLAISARIREMENHLLTRERMEQILEARSDEEVTKILQDCGYPQLDATHPEDMDAVLSAMREAVLSDLTDGIPDAGYIDIFKLKYDYHNAKSILKAKAMGASPERMLMDMGRVPAAALQAAVEGGDWSEIPDLLAEAVAEAQEVLETTRDPQLSDVLLDRWCYRDMAEVAKSTGSAFLMGYVQAQIDAANLRALIRALRMGKNETFLSGVLVEGGEVPVDSLLKISTDKGNGLEELYGASRFAEAAKAGAEAVKGGSLIAFEKLCDDAVADYLSGAQFVPFGEAPLVGYLAARETEYTNIRILLTGRSTGLAPEITRSRLRASYV